MNHWWKGWSSSSNLVGWYRNLTVTGRRCTLTPTRNGRSGGGWESCREGRGHTSGYHPYSEERWFRWSCYNHWKAVKSEGRQNLGYTIRGGGPNYGGNQVGGGLHWATESNDGAVVGPTPTLGGLWKRNGLILGGAETKVLVEIEDDQGDFVEHVGGGITGGATVTAGGG